LLRSAHQVRLTVATAQSDSNDITKKLKPMFTDNDRGQVGIGTLIVFIAMVLVAAIAAGVLINTAGLLQSQAEATGEESSAQVTDRVQVSTVTGTVGGGDATALEDDRVDRIALTVLRSPGADDIDLTNAIIEVFANGESGTLTHDEDQDDGDEFDGTQFDDPGEGKIGENNFVILNIQDADDGTLSDTSDRAQLLFDLSDIEDGSDGAALNTGDTVAITVTSAAGGTAFVEKRAPSSFEPGQTVRL